MKRKRIEEPQKRRTRYSLRQRKQNVIQSDGDYEIFVRIGGLHHVAENIFGRLDLQSLLRCQVVCKSWNEFIKEEKSVWIPHLRVVKNGFMINHFEVDMDSYRSKRFKCVNENRSILLIEIFPQWKEVIGHFEGEHPTFIKKFLKNMVKYLKVDWNELKNKLIEIYNLKGFRKLPDVFEPYCPLYYAADNADNEFIETVLPILPRHLMIDYRLFKKMVENGLNRSLKLILRSALLLEFSIRQIFVQSCSFKNLEMLKEIVQNWKDDFIKIAYPDLVNEGLWYAARNGHKDVVSFLLHNLSVTLCICQIGLTDNEGERTTALHIACHNGHFEVVKLLLHHLSGTPQYVHVNFKIDEGYTPLIVACQKKETEIVKLLLDQDDLEINVQDNHANTKLGGSAFYHACQSLSLECVKLLLQHPSIEINRPGERLTDLMEHFVPKSDIELESWTNLLEFLISLPNFDINDRDADGRTVLHFAVESNSGDPQLVRKILQQPNLDINAKDENGDTALAMAISNIYPHNMEVIQEIINYGVEKGNIDINDRDSDGRTLLHYVCGNDADEPLLVRKILQLPNVDINAKDDDGETALYFAVEKQNVEIIQEIINYGVEKGVKPNVITYQY